MHNKTEEMEADCQRLATERNVRDSDGKLVSFGKRVHITVRRPDVNGQVRREEVFFFFALSLFCFPFCRCFALWLFCLCVSLLARLLHPDRIANQIERFNASFKRKFMACVAEQRLHERQQRVDWSTPGGALERCVYDYNISRHRTIQMRPFDAFYQRAPHYPAGQEPLAYLSAFCKQAGAAVAAGRLCCLVRCCGLVRCCCCHDLFFFCVCMCVLLFLLLS
jgi:hypothetical protein